MSATKLAFLASAEDKIVFRASVEYKCLFLKRTCNYESLHIHFFCKQCSSASFEWSLPSNVVCLPVVHMASELASSSE